MKQYLWKDAQILMNKGNVYLCFSSTWCKDCITMQPVVEQLEQRCIANKLDIKFISVDADEAKIFKDKQHPLKVDYIPTHIFIKHGKIIETLYEIQSLDFLYEKAKQLIAMK